LQQRRIEQSMRVETKGRIAQLTTARQVLESIKDQVSKGTGVLRQDTQARARRAALQQRNSRATTIRVALSSVCEQVSLVYSDDEPVEGIIAKLDGHIADRTSQLTARQSYRRQLASEFRELRGTEEQLRVARQTVGQEQGSVRELN